MHAHSFWQNYKAVCRHSCIVLQIPVTVEGTQWHNPNFHFQNFVYKSTSIRNSTDPSVGCKTTTQCYIQFFTLFVFISSFLSLLLLPEKNIYAGLKYVWELCNSTYSVYGNSSLYVGGCIWPSGERQKIKWKIVNGKKKDRKGGERHIE